VAQLKREFVQLKQIKI